MIERSLFEYLVNTLWQLPLLATATWLIVRVARPPLLVQHFLWWIALSSAVLFPLRGIDSNPPASEIRVSHLNRSLTAIEVGEPIPTVPEQSAPIPSLTELRTAALRLAPRTIRWFLALYGVTIAFSLARLILGWRAARRLVAASTSHSLSNSEDALLRACATHLRLDPARIPSVRLTAHSDSPMVVGSVLLLPYSFTHLTPDELTAILAHELAHVRRRDYLANLVARVFSLPIAWHPATHYLHRRIRQTREMLCDAHAARAFPSAKPYAQSLLALAGRIVATPITVEAVGLFDHSRNHLEERIVILTAPKTPISFTQRAARIAAGSALLLAATGIAATLHLKPAPVYAAVVQEPVQEPATPPAAVPEPAPAPAPAPKPEPKPSPDPKPHVIIVDGQARDLTPEERQKLDSDLAAAHEKMAQVKAYLNSQQFKDEIANSVKAADLPDFKVDLDNLKVELKQLDTEKLRLQIAEAQKLAAESAVNSPEFKLKMDKLQTQLNSPEFKLQIEQAKRLEALDRPLIVVPSRERLAEARQKLNQAIQAAHDDPAQIQKAVDQFVQDLQPHAPKP